MMIMTFSAATRQRQRQRLMHWCVVHTAWAPEGRKGQSQASPKGHQLEVRTQPQTNVGELQQQNIATHILAFLPLFLKTFAQILFIS